MSISRKKIFIKYIALYLINLITSITSITFINTAKWQLESRFLEHIKVGVVIIQPPINELYR